MVAVVGEAFHLTTAADPWPGLSVCEWKRATDAYEMSLRVHGPEEFANQKMSGPSAFFAFAMSQPPCTRAPEVILKLGEQAVMCADGSRFHTVVVRRAKDVLMFTCPDCSREEASALARAAAR